MKAVARSGIAVAFALVLLIAAHPVRAVEPWEAGLQDHLAAYGLVCEATGMLVQCKDPAQDEFELNPKYRAQIWGPSDADEWEVDFDTRSEGLGPPHGDSLDFLVVGVSLVCPEDTSAIEAFIVENGASYAIDHALDGASCDFKMSTYTTEPSRDVFVSLQVFLNSAPAPSLTPALTFPPSLSPSISAPTPVPTIPLPSPTPAPTLAVVAPVDPAPPGAGRGSFDRVIARPGEITLDPVVIAQSAVLALLLVFLMPFPAQLFNSTLETHEAEVRRWFRLGSGGAVATLGRFWASWLGVGIFVALGALLYSFLDPGFGTDAKSLATFVGMLLGIVLVTAIASLPALVQGRRERVAAQLKVIPLSLAIGVVCVLASRLADFQPGYLYGVLIGLTFARELTIAEKGRATALAAGALLGVALVSWLALGVLPRAEADVALTIARTTLSALLVGGLEAVTIGLLPLRFLPGESLFRSNRLVWALLLGVGAFAFFHILINPASGYLSDTSRTPLLTTIALLVGFGLVSVAFWGWFRFRDSSAEARSASGP